MTIFRLQSFSDSLQLLSWELCFFFQILIIAEVWKLFLFLYTGECRLHIHFHYPIVLCHQECIRLYDYGWLDHCPESKNIHMQISPAVKQLALQDAIPGIQWSVSNSPSILYKRNTIKQKHF